MAPRARKRRDDDDEYDDLPIRKSSGGSNKPLLILLASGVIGLVLMACLVGAVIVAIIATADHGTQPDEFTGSWKGRWFLHGMMFDSVYTFNKDGTFREVAFDLQGRQMHASDGRWRFRDGQIEIDWNNGTIERAIATFNGRNVINYRIVNHSEFAQIGLTTTLRRQ